MSFAGAEELAPVSVLTYPNRIGDGEAKRIKEEWRGRCASDNAGRPLVVERKQLGFPWTCSYCRGTRFGMFCEGCGAPASEGKPYVGTPMQQVMFRK